uniref:Uncharacterized protein n=1 Tax=Anguilla anguilla TaxID=7936 RepID=A0A0E9S1V9_ANGAN
MRIPPLDHHHWGNPPETTRQPRNLEALLARPEGRPPRGGELPVLQA